MHNAAFKALGIDAEYLKFEKSPEEIPGFLHSLSAEHIKGINVTVPHKERVIPHLASITDEARLIGAVNTIKVSRDGLVGFNTDGMGFIRHLKEDLKFDPSGKTAVILGAGGAAKAVSVYLAKEGAQKISLFDIDREKREALAGHLQKNFKRLEVESVSSAGSLDLADAGLLINATPIGMKVSDPPVIDERLLSGDLLVYDLIYNPKETRLLEAARKKGAAASNGLGMLLYQGMASFEIWTGKKAPREVMWKALVNSA